MKTIQVLLFVLAVVTILFFIQKREYSKVGVAPFSSLRKPPPGMYEPARSRLKFLEKLAPSGEELAKGIAWDSHGFSFFKIDIPASSTSAIRIHTRARLILDDGTYLHVMLSNVSSPTAIVPGGALSGYLMPFSGASTLPLGRSVTAAEFLVIPDYPGASFLESNTLLSGPVVRESQRKGARIITCPVGAKPAPPKLPPPPP